MKVSVALNQAKKGNNLCEKYFFLGAGWEEKMLTFLRSKFTTSKHEEKINQIPLERRFCTGVEGEDEDEECCQDCEDDHPHGGGHAAPQSRSRSGSPSHPSASVFTR